MKTLQRWTLVFVLAIVVVVPQNIFSCGPFFESATFSFDPHPDYPIKDYIAGKLGVVKPSFYRLFLVVAYRNLSGHPFTPKETVSIDHLLTEEAQYADEFGMYGMADNSNEPAPPPPPSRVWLEERAKVLGEQPGPDTNIDPNKPYGEYQNFLNCNDDAFKTAVQTLHDRQQKWGATSADVKAWLAGQDAVFANCSGKVFNQPSAVATKNTLLQQDRDYQIASAFFYSGNPDQLVQAQQKFDAIGQDKTSPWRSWGPYLAARSLIRAATLKGNEQQRYDQKLMADAEAKLKSILADKSLASVHPATSKMLGFVEARVNPASYTQELAHRLTNGTSTDLAQDFIDYRYMLDNGPGDANGDLRKDELTDWIRTFQAGDKEKDHAIAKWKDTKSLPWLVAAISAVGANDAAARDLLAAAAKADAHDPRLLTVLYRRVVLLRALKSDAEARSLIDANIAYLGKEAPISSHNLFWGHRMALATSYDDFLRFAPREDAEGHHAQANVKPGSQAPPNTPNDVYFDADSTSVLNRAIPLALLDSATTKSQLAKPLQAQVAQATWVRALLLDNSRIANSLSTQVKQSTPVLASYADDYAKDTIGEQRHRTTLWALLHNPGMRPYIVPNMQREGEMDKIDNFRDNWWCEDVGVKATTTNWKDVTGDNPEAPAKTPPAPAAPFLRADEQKQGATEWSTLSKIGAAPSYLGREVLAWAKAAPDDPRIPEALHLVVRATRYGCGDDKTSSYSKQAFQLLHSKYPKSEWTKKTPYFY